MSWVSVFAGFLVAHMVGDYLFQTDWQARNKRAGLSGGVAAKALFAHVATYTAAFLPAFIWIADELDAAWALASAVLVFLPHLVIDDGRLVGLYIARVKRVPDINLSLTSAVDQSFHVLSLFLLAVVVGAA